MNGTPTMGDLFLAVWPRIVTFDFARYIIATGVMSLVVAIAGFTAWSVRRIQDRRATRADYLREILTSIRTALLFSFVGVAIFIAQHYGILAHAPAFTWPSVILTLLAMLVVQDAYFYWTHRAMHHPRLFKVVHRLHHQSVTPTPFTAYAFSVPEALTQAAFVPLWMVFVPTNQTVPLIFMTVMIVRNVWGHAGLETHPRGMADHSVFGLLTTTVHHDLHHGGSFNHNFGLYFTWWDRMMGTEHPQYRQRFREVTGRSAAAAPAGEVSLQS